MRYQMAATVVICFAAATATRATHSFPKPTVFEVADGGPGTYIVSVLISCRSQSIEAVLREIEHQKAPLSSFCGRPKLELEVVQKSDRPSRFPLVTLSCTSCGRPIAAKERLGEWETPATKQAGPIFLPCAPDRVLPA